jgi:hypothetical protein
MHERGGREENEHDHVHWPAHNRGRRGRFGPKYRKLKILVFGMNVGIVVGVVFWKQLRSQRESSFRLFGDRG